MIRKRNGRFEPLVYSPAHGKKVTARVLLDEPSSYSTEREAKRVHRRMEDVADQAAVPTAVQLTVREFADTWQARWPRPKASTQDTYRRALEALTSFDYDGVTLGDVELVSFTRDMARAFVLEHNRLADVARTMFNDAIHLAEIPGLLLNPFAHVTTRQGGKRDLALSWDELTEFASCAPMALGAYGHVMSAAIMFSAGTGLRIGEMCSMEWDWIDDNDLIVRSNFDPKSQKDTSPKGGRVDDVIAILPFAREALNSIPRSLGRFVWTLPGGTRWRQPSVHYHFQQVRSLYLASARMTPRRHEQMVGRKRGHGLVFHTLRHTHASLLADQGFDRWSIAAQMRHTDPKLVDTVYRNIDQEKTRKAMVDGFRSPIAARLGDTVGDTGAS